MPRHLSTDALVSIGCASLELRGRAAEKLCGIIPSVNLADLRRMTEEGFLDAKTILVNGREEFCIWVHKTADGGLHLNCAVQIPEHTSGFDYLVQGVEGYARSENLKFVRFATNRMGLVKIAKENGYSATSVILQKIL